MVCRIWKSVIFNDKDINRDQMGKQSLISELRPVGKSNNDHDQ